MKRFSKAQHKDAFNITHYALQSFKHYGGKSIIIMIVLAITLVLGLLNISTSFQRSVELAAISSAGDAHFQILDVTPEQIEELKSLNEIEWAGEFSYLFRLLAEVSGKTTGLIYLETLEVMDGFKITRGRSPQKINEIALSSYMAEYFGIEARVGTEFDVELHIENEIIPFRFVISGIIQDQEFHKIMEAYYIYVSKEFVDTYAIFASRNDGDTISDDRNALVKLKKGYDAYITAPKIADTIGVEHNKLGYNFSYLRASMHGSENRIIVGSIIAFFMLVGALIIYNAFNIIIAKRTRHFGLLTLIGASKKQIHKCVYIEAILNTVVALPIGLLLGTFFSWVVMPLVSDISEALPMYYHINPYSYLLTILIVILMVSAGAVIPAKLAGKITPVEAAKFSAGGIKTSKKTKSLKPGQKISLLTLSRINLLRRKGAGGVIISLSVVGMLFISIATILFSAYSSLGNLVKNEMASDIKVMRGIREGASVIFRDEKSMFPEHIIEQIVNLDGVEDAKIFYFQNYQIPGLDASYVNGVRYETGYILGVDDEIMLQYLNQAAIYEGDKNNLAAFEKPENVLMLYYFSEMDEISYWYNIDDDLSIDVLPVNYLQDDEPAVGHANLRISAVANLWFAPPYINIWASLPTLIMPLSSYKANNFDMDCHTINLNIDESKYDSIITALEMICAEEGNIHFRSFTGARKEYENMLMSVMILIFMGLGIVFAVGLLNLVSSTFIGIEQRKKELGVLSALGLGQQDLKMMLKLEGVWVSLFSSVISIAGGSFLAWRFSLYLEDMGNYITVSPPMLTIIIFSLVYIFVPYIVSSVAVRKLLKNTMVELIGQDI